MTNLVWPAGLPQCPSVGGYQERFTETALRTPMEAGVAKLRRRFTRSRTITAVLFFRHSGLI
jgi:hypothetical protein